MWLVFELIERINPIYYTRKPDIDLMLHLHNISCILKSTYWCAYWDDSVAEYSQELLMEITLLHNTRIYGFKTGYYGMVSGIMLTVDILGIFREFIIYFIATTLFGPTYYDLWILIISDLCFRIYRVVNDYMRTVNIINYTGMIAEQVWGNKITMMKFLHRND